MLRSLLILALSSCLMVSAEYPQGHNVSFYFRSCSLSGRLANGMCCDVNRYTNCPAHCDVHFVVCIREHNETSNYCNSNTSSHVTFLHYAYLDVRNLTFFEGDNVFGVGLHNPLVYAFAGNWTKRIQTVLIARDFDFDTDLFDGYRFQNIDYIDVNWTVAAEGPEDGRTFNGTYSNMVVVVGLKVECWEGWYGDYCTVFCVPSNNDTGHYECTLEGEKRCLEGWSGAHCLTGVCTPPCENHANCNNATRVCECENGFRKVETLCECAPSGGCDPIGGYCQIPGDCQCRRGYSGTDCDVRDTCLLDSNPCRNGGVCVPTGNNTYNCSCATGYQGDQCGFMACPNTGCAGVLGCGDHGDCSNTSSGIRCSCERGYIGRCCDTPYDFCLDNPCVHGVCQSMIGDYRCECDAGYDGKECHQPINECDPRPCQNNGTCQDRIADYKCGCVSGFSGKDCNETCADTLLCECEAKCEYGKCNNSVSGYMCQCDDGFTGMECEVDIDECVGRCENGANCTDGVDTFNCHCPDGYMGNTCAVDIDECTTGIHMCENGMCVNTAGGYSCSCDTGYSGQLCGVFVQLNYCGFRDPCLNGTCQNENFGTRCECRPGFTGENCSTAVDPCDTIVCNYNASCVSGGCVCPPAYTGATCGTEVDVCEVLRGPSDCGNGACVNDLSSATGYRCECTTGYEGVRCEVDIDDCDSSPCLNGANCTDSLNAFICDCTRGYAGDKCEDMINLCDVNTCQNGGSCVVEDGTPSCQCPTGYVQPLCEKNEDCGRESCNNKGECKGISKDLKAAFCVCDAGYTGTFCEELINFCASSPCSPGATCYQGVDSYYCRCENSVAGCVEEGKADISTNSVIPGVENSVSGLLGGVGLGVVLTLLGVSLVAALLCFLHLRARKRRQRRRQNDTRRVSLYPLLVSDQNDPLFAGNETYPVVDPPTYNSLLTDTKKVALLPATISEKQEVFENKIPL